MECEVDGERSTEVTEAQKAELEAILQAHDRVFREMQGLPPIRELEH